MDDKFPPVAVDLMVGADPIAIFLYGNDDPSSVRNVYRNPLKLTFFKHGNSLAAFKSTLRAELAEAENRARKARTSTSDSGRAA